MSKLAKKPLIIPDKVNVTVDDNKIVVSGPLGSLSQNLHPKIKVIVENKSIKVQRMDDEKISKSLHGLYYSLIKNMLIGVTKGYEKKLEIVGVGYQCQHTAPNELTFKLKFSHPVKFSLPEGVNAKIDKNIITLTGIDKYLVGETAAKIRRILPPEPYKGTGIKYSDEKIIRKAGKTAIGVKK